MRLALCSAAMQAASPSLGCCLVPSSDCCTAGASLRLMPSLQAS